MFLLGLKRKCALSLCIKSTAASLFFFDTFPAILAQDSHCCCCRVIEPEQAVSFTFFLGLLRGQLTTGQHLLWFSAVCPFL